MGACRESSRMERALDRFLSQIRNTDRVLWSYSGKNIEKEDYPLSSFGWVDDEIEDSHRLWMDFMNERLNEKKRVIELNNIKHPAKITDFEEMLKANVGMDSVISALIPKR